MERVKFKERVLRYGRLLHQGPSLCVPQDYAEAAKWYRKAADQGDALAQSNLGTMLHNGQSMPQDYGEAVKWFREAADQEEPVAQDKLGGVYEYGEGVAQDYVLAHM
jgi:TPR repeat protein